MPSDAALPLRPPERPGRDLPRSRRPDRAPARRRHAGAAQRVAPHAARAASTSTASAPTSPRGSTCIPRYRQRLAYVPLERHPVWVDDDHFQIDFHVRHTALPQPGDRRQLKRLSGRILSQRLDRTRPLWELWVVEGLEGGDRFAIVQKAHHCDDRRHLRRRPDGRAARAARPSTSSRPARPGGRGPRRARRELLRAPSCAGAPPTRAGCLARRARPRCARPARFLAHAPRERAGGGARRSRAGFRSASHTPLNHPLGMHRSFDWLDMKLADVKRVKDRLGGTVNDVVLATVAGALRRFLDRAPRRRRPPPDPRQRAGERAQPPSERGRLGNRIALWMTDLPVSEPDPLRAPRPRARDDGAPQGARSRRSAPRCWPPSATGRARRSSRLAVRGERARAPVQPRRHERAGARRSRSTCSAPRSRPATRW